MVLQRFRHDRVTNTQTLTTVLNFFQILSIQVWRGEGEKGNLHLRSFQPKERGSLALGGEVSGPLMTSFLFQGRLGELCHSPRKDSSGSLLLYSFAQARILYATL